MRTSKLLVPVADMLPLVIGCERKTPSEQARDNMQRIVAIWRDCRARFGAGGEFLFGAFSAADAMYAPVASRFTTYGIDLAELGDDGTAAHVDLARLIIDRHAAMQDAEAALAGHRDGHPRLSDGIHGRRQQRDANGDVPRQPGGRVDLAGDDVRLTRQQQHVVKRQAQSSEFLGDGGVQRAHQVILSGRPAAMHPW